MTFPVLVNKIAKQNNEIEWDFNLHEAKQVRSTQEFKHYMNSWDEKWQIVKDLVCHKDLYNCEKLEKIELAED